MNQVRRSFAILLILGVSASAIGCGGGDDATGACPEGDSIAGACAGVPQAAVCADETCPENVTCASIMVVGDDGTLASVAAAAGQGACITLEPGSYGAVSLPGGVSLLGRSAGEVHVEGITLGAGSGATVRGLSVGAGGLKVNGATSARIDSVRAAGSSGTGIEVAAGSEVSIVASTIEKSARYGLTVADGAAVTLERALIAANEGPGVWAACSSDCMCAEPPDLAITSSIIRDNRLVGVALFAATAKLDGVDVVGTQPGDTWHYGLGGGGISAASCSSLSATALRVLDSKLYGVLIDGSSASIGAQDMGKGVEISRNFVGLWAQNVGAPGSPGVALENVSVEDNDSVGIGVGGESKGLIICKSAISGTRLRQMPVEGLGPGDLVGDGLAWQGGSEIVIEGLALHGNERGSVVIDGEAGGSLANITLSGGDEAKGIVQQNYSGGAQPELKTNTPALTTAAGQQFSVPLAPKSVPRNL